jgi:hypothetical protein
MNTRQTVRGLGLLACVMFPMAVTGTASAGLMLKGGTSRFLEGLDKVTTRGMAWGLGYSFQPSSFVAIETVSEGSRNVLNDPQSPSTTGLLRLGETTFVKFVLPVLPVVHPFVGAGLALDYVMVQGGDSSFGIPGIPGVPGQSEARYSSGMFVHFPIGAGIEFDFKAVTLGARVTYHYVAASPFAKDIAPNFLDLAVTIAL